ncbi:MAG: methyltransferase domain-containing protein [Acidimicrobiales bacterium]
MPRPPSPPERYDSMRAKANFGLPVPRGASGRLLRRMVARLCWPMLRNQVDLNWEVVGELLRHDDILLDVLWDRDVLREQVELIHQQSFARLNDAVGMIRSELGELVLQLRAEMEEAAAANGELRPRLAEMGARLERDEIRLAQVDLVLDRVRHSLPEVPPAEELAELPGAFDNLYAAFAEAFRGPREAVKERMRPYVADILAVDSALPVVDLGCGRGELIELLTEAGVACYGVETNLYYVKSGTAAGLDVRHAEATAHLAELKEHSLRAVTAIQLVAHLPLERLIELLDLAVRAIEPGGALVLETPNPGNLVVGSSSFYLDPTRRQPIPPELLAFLVEARGFTSVEVRRLARDDAPRLEPVAAGEPWSDDVRRILDLVGPRLFDAPDYAVIARRP